MLTPATPTIHTPALLSVLGLMASCAMAQTTASPDMRPPPAAVEACAGLGEEAACVFTGPHGEREGLCLAGPDPSKSLACVPTADIPDLTYPILDSGQSQCYDAAGTDIQCPNADEPFAGQDAQHRGWNPVFEDQGDGTVLERVTGLVWQTSPDTDGDGLIHASDKLTYAEALDHCEGLTLGGRDDWRLPDIKTLYSLIDFSGTDPSGTDESTGTDLRPFIDTEHFDFAYGDTTAGERLIDAQYASSTLYVSDMGFDARTLFGVNFADGRIKGYGLDHRSGEKTFYVICVSGNAGYGVNAFADNGDGTVSDAATGLMWSRQDSGIEAPQGLDWREALDWVQTRNAQGYLGHRDWRLPNAKELQSLVDYGRAPDATGGPAIDPLFETTAMVNEAGQTDFPYIWSSTTHASASSRPGANAAYLSFGRALGYMEDGWYDVHGAGAQRSDPKTGDPGDYPYGHGPQGDAIRIYNAVRLVRDLEGTDPVAGAD
ncbi:Lcl C-terminal domain-containing protein [Imhoffiella purpurea]|nr:DUF1566 domain-containing protein [Imhoffiella purpurea]